MALFLKGLVRAPSFTTLSGGKSTCFGCIQNLKNSTQNFSSFRNLQKFQSFTPKQKVSFKPYQLSSLRKTATIAVTELSASSQTIVGSWMFGCAGMCFGAVILGGLTRLTESGLSMVDWKLIKDMKPPTNHSEWEAEFDTYKQYPEFKHMAQEKEMTLSDFKFIFYMEWGHRMWGRATGLVFILPALFFLKKGWISKALKPRLAIFTGLLGFQGFLGWYMVKSGLGDQAAVALDGVPRVSQYRLASHLGSAFILYSLFLWQGFNHLLTPKPLPDVKSLTRLRGLAHGVMAAVFVTALSGAFVAGLDAGLTYNSYPKMADSWVPSDLISEHISPKWKNIFENPTTVQFNHRHLAESTVLFISGFWLLARKAPLHPRARLALNCLMGMAVIQVSLGVTTLLTYVNTNVAATHQSGSLVLLSFAIWVAHELRRMPK